MLMMWAMLTFHPVPSAANASVCNNLLAALLVVIFGFLFVTVSSRITGLIGTSSNPISGMAIATSDGDVRHVPGHGLDWHCVLSAGHHALAASSALRQPTPAIHRRT